MPEYKILGMEDLSPFPLREIRKDVLEKLRERLKKNYNPARPLTVVSVDGKNIVVDGNHRLEVIKDLKIEKVPCLVYSEDEVDNVYTLAIECNQDEDTYAPMDLFDWLEIIRKLREQGKKQREIAEVLGWSREKVKDYMRILNKVGAEILDFAKQYQIGRAPQNGANAPTFNFTEGWFRDSGIYDLPVVYDDEGNVVRNRQMELME